MATLSQVSSSNENKSSFRTAFLEHTHDFRWEVENFPNWLRDTNTTIVKTPTFHPVLNRNFCAVLRKEKKNGLTNLKLHFVLEYGPSILIEYHLSITNASGVVANIGYINFIPHQSHFHHISNKECFYTFDSDKLENFCLESNSTDLIFHCTMKMAPLETEVVNTKVEEIEIIHPTKQDRNSSQPPIDNVSILIDDLKGMFNNSKYTDVTLHVDGQCLSAHKSILTARSPVFENKLSDTADELTITDIQMPALKNMLQFIYTGQLHNNVNFESVFELYHAAYLYDVHSLLQTCVNILLSELDINNACRLLSLLDNHHDDNFRGKVMDFIQSHYNDIIGTDEWDQFVDNHVQLAAKVIKACSKMVKK